MPLAPCPVFALSTLAEDPSAPGVIGMEEHENGIQPARMPAILDLLQAMACDPIGNQAMIQAP